MPAESVLSRKEPIRGLKPFVSAALAASALLLSSCASVQLALDRMGSARNTTFKPTSSCPSTEGNVKNATLFLVENTTSFKIDSGLTFKGKAYTNDHYVMCMMENATNAYVLEPGGTVVAILTKGKNGSYLNGNEEVLRQTKDGGFELISESDYIFGNKLGSLATRRDGAVALATPQIRPTVLSQSGSQENNGRLDFLQPEIEFSQPVIVLMGLASIALMGIITAVVVNKSKQFDKANLERWNNGDNDISDIGRPDPRILKKDPIPTFRFPPNQIFLPPEIHEEGEEIESLFE